MNFEISGFQEAVFHVQNLDQYQHFFETVGGWQTLYSGELESDWQQLWQFDSSARQVVLGNPGDDRGYIRLVQQDTPARQQIRSNAQAWEIGGFLDINIRVLDMQKKFEQLQSCGWRGSSDPVEWDWEGLHISEWLAHGPDGLSIAFIQRIAPPLEDFDTLREFSRVTNSTQIVPNLAEARRFYEEVLGFQITKHTKGTQQHPGENVFGMPHDMINKIPHEVIVLHPQGLMEGSVELIEFEGIEGKDFSSYSHPKNLGIIALRFPVKNLEALEQSLLDAGFELSIPPREVTLPPYGKAKLLAVHTPNGAWLEFYELI